LNKFKDKEIRIILSKIANEDYSELNKLVNEEIKQGITSSENQTILRSVKRVIEWLKNNPFYGEQIEKSKFPECYKKDYDITNLWRIDLANYWRLVYTVRSNEIEIICLILNIYDHEKYNKIFKYRKK